MSPTEYEEALIEKARHLYCVLVMDPLRVPLLDERNKGLYPTEIKCHTQMEFWTELVDELQIIRP